MLGSSYGSTAPRSINPATGKPYGPDFPDITLGDIVNAQRRLLDDLGVRHLVAVAGPSFGGYQAFQWAVTYPDFMDGIVAVVTAPKGPGNMTAVQALLDRFAADPDWHGGWHYDSGGIPETMTALRVETLERYGQNEILATAFPDPARRKARIREMAEAWARQFDPNSMVTLRRAQARFDAERHFGRDPRPRALRAVAHRQAVSAGSRSRRHGEALRGRRGRPLRRDRHRVRPLGQRRGLEEVGAGPRGVPGGPPSLTTARSPARGQASPR